MIANMAESKLNSEKGKAIEAALLNIEKKFGKGSIMRLGEREVVDVPVIPTTSLSLDAAIGIGGMPRGRVVEIYGPESSGKTTLALHVVAEAQRIGGVAAYIDAEHAMDAEYAKKLGVQVDDLLISQPDSGEQALEIAEALVRSNGVDVVVIDSVAALVPRAELDGEMGDSLPGLQARLMSQALRKLTAIVASSNTCFIFINQIREKIGVMFGCFHYDTRVMLADGTSEKIGKIVNNRMPVEVLSYNSQTGAIEPKKVVNWFDNGRADYFLQFEVEGGKSGRRHFAATPNHMIFTPYGEMAAEDLRVGDEVLGLVNDLEITDDQKQVILGSGLGDGSLRQVSSSAASFRVGHGANQEEYVHWKHERNPAPVCENTNEARKMRAVPAKITKIYVKPATRSMQRFDIEVEGNHTYLVDGVVVHNSPETTTGGRALKFYSSLRMDIRRIGSIKDGEHVVGNRTKVKIAKNKVAPPFRECEFDIMYGEGISRAGDLLDLAVTHKIVDKSGAWFSYKGDRLGQGRENAKVALKDPQLARKIETEVRKVLGLPLPVVEEPAAPPAAPKSKSADKK
jgi:RecA/RadA recombinase